MGSGLLIGFIEYLQTVTTSTYSAKANSRILQFTTTCTKSQSAVTSPVVGLWRIQHCPLLSCSYCWLLSYSWLIAPIILLITFRQVPHSSIFPLLLFISYLAGRAANTTLLLLFAGLCLATGIHVTVFYILNVKNGHFLYILITFLSESISHKAPLSLGSWFQPVSSIGRGVTGYSIMLTKTKHFQFYVALTPRTNTISSGFLFLFSFFTLSLHLRCKHWSLCDLNLKKLEDFLGSSSDTIKGPEI
jgi:hypothetical protein